MPSTDPVLLLVSTQTWLQTTRMAVRLVCYGAEVHALCPAEHEVRFYKGLKRFYPLDPRRWLDGLERAIASSGADYLIPCDDQAVWLLHNWSRGSEQARILVERSIGPAFSYPIVHSRLRLLELAQELGVAVPPTTAAHNAEQARSWAAQHGFPFVLKKDGTFGGEGVAVISSPELIAPFYARLGEDSTAQVCAQAFVEGTAANAMFASYRGRILGVAQAQVLAAKGKTGPSLVFRLIQDERIASAGAAIAGRLGLSGFFGLDFILNSKTGVPELIELNPRSTQLGHIPLRGEQDLIARMWERWSGRGPLPAGAPDLSETVFFHPAAKKWNTDSALLAPGRADIYPEDLAVIDELARGNPAPLARLRFHTRAMLVQVRNAVRPPTPPPIHYFETLSDGHANGTNGTGAHGVAHDHTTARSADLGAPEHGAFVLGADPQKATPGA